MLLRLNMFAEITKASCSFVGAWGEATIKDTGKTYQLRALDYDTVGMYCISHYLVSYNSYICLYCCIAIQLQVHSKSILKYDK